MATWLVDHVDSIRQDDAAPEMVTWARSLRDAIRWQVDNLGTRFAGPCHARVRVLVVGGTETPSEDSEAGESISGLPMRTIDRECGEPLRTRSGDSVIVCRECKTRHDAAEVWARIIQDNHDVQARPVELADALTSAGWPIKAATIRKWGERGKLQDWREDDLGRPLYRLGDVLDLIVETATRRTG
jgi:hypothetical protein